MRRKRTIRNEWIADAASSCKKWCMAAEYAPASEFLKAIVTDGVPIGESGFAAHNLERLINMTRDADVSNRDWATMLLAQSDINTPEVIAALIKATADENDVVRAEALLGIARRDRSLALPLAAQALQEEFASMAVFEAAEIIADPTLVPLLQPWTEESDETFLDDCARRAMSACQLGRQPS